jgi:hypothetical protein
MSCKRPVKGEKVQVIELSLETGTLCEICGVRVKSMYIHKRTQRHRENKMEYLIQEHIIGELVR